MLHGVLIIALTKQGFSDPRIGEFQIGIHGDRSIKQLKSGFFLAAIIAFDRFIQRPSVLGRSKDGNFAKRFIQHKKILADSIEGGRCMKLTQLVPQPAEYVHQMTVPVVSEHPPSLAIENGINLAVGNIDVGQLGRTFAADVKNVALRIGIPCSS
ncbi:hypothetical protein D1872_244960 [compost metagenome]